MDKPRWMLILVALACFAVGLIPTLDALGVFPGSAARLNAPRWIVLVVASLFLMAGVYILLIAAVGEAMARAFGMALGLAVVLGLAATLHWIAFGESDRGACGGGIAASGIGLSGGARDMECRAAFGYFALLLDFLLLRGLAKWWVARDPVSQTARVADRIFEWGVGLLLLPLVLLVALAARVKAGWHRIAGKLRSGGGDGH